MKVVSNSSPLIILYKCGKLELLKQLFGQVLIPTAVHQEVIYNTKDTLQSEAISRCDFLQVHPISGRQFKFSHRIDRGEAEAITLAASIQADFLLLDDKRAQKEAVLHHIDFIPTFALLLKAAQKGIISDFEAVLAELQQKNIFLSRELSLAAQIFLDLK